MIDLTQALVSLRPNSQWSLTGDDYSGLVWYDSNELEPPTEAEVLAEAERLHVEFTNNQYQRDRQKEYPDFGTQMDIIYHQGLDAWREEINKVKEKYPKPEAS